MSKICREIYLFAVIDPDTYMPDLTFDDVDGDDYLVYCIYDRESDTIIFLNDNMHDHPDDVLRGFLYGLQVAGQESKVIEEALYINNNERPYDWDCVRAAINRYFEK